MSEHFRCSVTGSSSKKPGVHGGFVWRRSPAVCAICAVMLFTAGCAAERASDLRMASQPVATSPAEQPATSMASPEAPNIPSPGQDQAEQAIGLPIYPDAQPLKGLEGVLQAGAGQDDTRIAVLETSAVPDDVLRFYRPRLHGAHATRHNLEGVEVITLSQNDARGHASVEISRREGKTRIELLREPTRAPEWTSRPEGPGTPDGQHRGASASVGSPRVAAPREIAPVPRNR